MKAVALALVLLVGIGGLAYRLRRAPRWAEEEARVAEARLEAGRLEDARDHAKRALRWNPRHRVAEEVRKCAEFAIYMRTAPPESGCR